ncbi:MAG: hypothetical protein ACTSUV_00775 [Candidatus Ranarchaeia archaeon]
MIVHKLEITPLNVRGIWIIDEAGLCMYHQGYSGFFIDPQKFSALFTALYYFSTETKITKNGKKIYLQNFKWGNYCFHVHSSQGKNFVLCTDTPSDSLSCLFSIIETQFFKYFKGNMLLLSELLINSTESREIKRKFSQDLKNIIQDHIQKPLLPLKTTNFQEIVSRNPHAVNEVISKWGEKGLMVFLMSDGRTPLLNIAEKSKLSKEILDKILMDLSSKGLIDLNVFQEPVIEPVNQSRNMNEIIREIN